MDTPPASHDWLMLRDALLAGDAAGAARLLARSPALAHARNRDGRTVLHSLALLDHAPAVAWLHARGARLDTRDATGQPLLFGIARRGHFDLLHWCLANGADARIAGAHGDTLLDHLPDDADYDAFWGIAALLEA